MPDPDRLLGIQFDELFRDDLYLKIGEPAIRAAARIRGGLQQQGYRLCFGSPTNQVFCVMENRKLELLAETVLFEYWGTKQEDVGELLRVIGRLA